MEAIAIGTCARGSSGLRRGAGRSSGGLLRRDAGSRIRAGSVGERAERGGIVVRTDG